MSLDPLPGTSVTEHLVMVSLTASIGPLNKPMHWAIDGEIEDVGRFSIELNEHQFSRLMSHAVIQTVSEWRAQP